MGDSYHSNHNSEHFKNPTPMEYGDTACVLILTVTHDSPQTLGVILNFPMLQFYEGLLNILNVEMEGES